MGQVPYSSYHGRKRHLRSALIGIVTALVVLLAAVLAGYYLGLFNLPGELPDGSKPVPVTAAPAGEVSTGQAPADQEPAVIVESAAPSPTPAAATADLSGHVIRDIPLGLVLATPDALPETAKDGVLVDMTGADMAALGDDFAEKLAALPYAAAWLDGADADACLSAAALGFDEIVLASAVPTDDGAALAESYRNLRAGLDKAGWLGRLGLDVDQGLFATKYDGDLVPAIAQSFERLYFRSTLTLNNKNALSQNGFVATGYTIVTALKQASNPNYAWAILPQ